MKPHIIFRTTIFKANYCKHYKTGSKSFKRSSKKKIIMNSKAHKAGRENFISNKGRFSLEWVEKVGHTIRQEKEEHKIVSFLP